MTTPKMPRRFMCVTTDGVERIGVESPNGAVSIYRDDGLPTGFAKIPSCYVNIDYIDPESEMVEKLRQGCPLLGSKDRKPLDSEIIDQLWSTPPSEIASKLRLIVSEHEAERAKAAQEIERLTKENELLNTGIRTLKLRAEQLSTYHPWVRVREMLEIRTIERDEIEARRDAIQRQYNELHEHHRMDAELNERLTAERDALRGELDLAMRELADIRTTAGKLLATVVPSGTC